MAKAGKTESKPPDAGPLPPVKSPVDKAALDTAFEALKTFDYGSARAALLPIDDAVALAAADPKARKDLEGRLAGALGTNLSKPAKGFLCRMLARIGSADCVVALAALLDDADLSVLARASLEQIPDAAAGKALRDRLPALQGMAKVGVIQSLGARRDAESAPALAALLNDADAHVAGAAAAALGEIGTPESAAALRTFLPRAPQAILPTAADAALVCADRLTAANRRDEARTLLETTARCTLPKHIAAAVQRRLAG
ncbi:MAG: HEAT repeat domain-containing protein [Candidatus Sumerlaeia bacterium]|nr:HEAT repeat domain-containing protein [Candidatus Sumerlaeia bacterium]